jgi:hypothetical protein
MDEYSKLVQFYERLSGFIATYTFVGRLKWPIYCCLEECSAIYSLVDEASAWRIVFFIYDEIQTNVSSYYINVFQMTDSTENL